MAVYIGSKKVKELYFGGKKIKEAWYGGKKVYSSGPPAWENGARYVEGDLVTINNGIEDMVYRCVRLHWADYTNHPFRGSNASTYWTKVTASSNTGGSTPTQPTEPPSTTPAWKPGTSYSEGDVVYHNGEYYKCNYSHYTDPSWDEPGKGSIWTGYWDKVSDPNAETYPQWMYTNHYEVGDRVTESIDGVAKNYECIQANFGSLEERPSGPKGRQYWKRI